ncbi:hypothetical protein FPH17_08485 [Corynebacterium godavarianum]|uniref:UvrABC system protein A n=1 Tax=Corynebacterium godavarianum TaxID=2054421 RepID=A0ABY3E0B0_9CORY|nr:hypothetical protein [Corynebacterium godavarianum]MBL7286593.1 hypothetical protein [Corynebacterium godavarianum]TSJ73013.1 hypothetical protein FPH17_08485 [Corynebacterium godavarianum]
MNHQVAAADAHDVIVVEHNLALVSRVDYVIDLGPGAGSAGDKVVAAGTARELADKHAHTGSETGRYLAMQESKRAAQKWGLRRRFACPHGVCVMYQLVRATVRHTEGIAQTTQ